MKGGERMIKNIGNSSYSPSFEAEADSPNASVAIDCWDEPQTHNRIYRV